MTIQERVQVLLKGTGVVLNGPNPWDPQIHNEGFYKRVLTKANLGLGESYMDGWWDCNQIDEFISRLLKANIQGRMKRNLPSTVVTLASILLNRQSSKRAFHIGEAHYDVGNDLYSAMLDKRLVYTCGYWKDAQTLDEAQEAKLDLVCRKIGLKNGDKVLDIGCGWGSFAKFAAEKYGARVVGVTVSKEQKALANKLCAGLPVEIRLQDYREVNEQFDHVVSLGMVEHVGYKNYGTYMKVAAKNLKEGGFFLLHTIGSSTSGKSPDPWIDKYIFPNSMLPSMAQLTKAAEKLFVLEDVHNFGSYYDTTLLKWNQNLEAAWPQIKHKYDERFHRMWRYYLMSCAGIFRSRNSQLWQLVLSKGGVNGVYEAVR